MPRSRACWPPPGHVLGASQRHTSQPPCARGVCTVAGGSRASRCCLWTRFSREVRRLWAWMISRCLPTSAKSAAVGRVVLGCGRGESILGGGATLSLLPLAGPWWQGSECPLPTPAQENLVPGPAARLLFEMSPVGGTLAWLRCSGLKGDGLYVLPSVKVLLFIRGNLSAESWTRPCSSPGEPSHGSSLPYEGSPGSGVAPRPSGAWPRPSSLALSPPDTPSGMYQPLSSVQSLTLAAASA